MIGKLAYSINIQEWKQQGFLLLLRYNAVEHNTNAISENHTKEKYLSQTQSEFLNERNSQIAKKQNFLFSIYISRKRV